MKKLLSPKLLPVCRASPASGFSLVEILISVAVMAALVALCLAAFSFSANQARAVHHTSNHRQIATGLLAYTADHSGNFPWCTDNTHDKTSQVFTRLLVAGGYIINPEVFFSPWTPKWWRTGSAQTNVSRPDRESSIPWYYTSYGVNRKGIMPRLGLDNARKKPANLMRISADGVASRLMILRDVYDVRVPERGGGIAHFGGSSYLPEPENRNGYRRIHAAYADGHVESYTPEEYLRLIGDPRAAPLYDDVYTSP